MEAIIKEKTGVDWTLCKDGSKHEGAVIGAVSLTIRKNVSSV